jgi:hypothetical protein
MPWIGLAAAFPDRDLPMFATLLSALLNGPVKPTGAKLEPSLHRLAKSIADPPRGARLAESIYDVLQPWVVRANELDAMRVDRDQAVQRSAAARIENERLEAELAGAAERSLELAAQASAATEAATETRSESERRLAEASGRAQQERARTAQRYGPEIRALASDVLMYLDRVEPNVEGAMRRARELAELGDRLEGQER